MKIKTAIFGGFWIAASLINCHVYFSGPPLFVLRSDLYAQDIRYPFKEYADRKEGIIKKEQLVAGEKLLFISAAIENSEPLPARNVSSYHLKFYFNDTARVSIEVWQYEKSYKMEPFLKFYDAGLTKFSWSSKIPLYYKITPNDLFPIAKTSYSGYPLYLPIAFYCTDSGLKGQYYSFGFIPLKSIDSLEYKFYRFQTTNPIHSGRLGDIKKDRKVFIFWNGKEQNNKAADSGLYTLVITTAYAPKPGTRRTPPVTTRYQFYHYAEFLQR